MVTPAKPPVSQPEFMSRKEFARQIERSLRTVDKLVKEQRLTVTRKFGGVLIHRSSLQL